MPLKTKLMPVFCVNGSILVWLPSCLFPVPCFYDLRLQVSVSVPNSMVHNLWSVHVFFSHTAIRKTYDMLVDVFNTALLLLLRRSYWTKYWPVQNLNNQPACLRHSLSASWFIISHTKVPALHPTEKGGGKVRVRTYCKVQFRKLTLNFGSAIDKLWTFKKLHLNTYTLLYMLIYIRCKANKLLENPMNIQILSIIITANVKFLHFQLLLYGFDLTRHHFHTGSLASMLLRISQIRKYLKTTELR